VLSRFSQGWPKDNMADSRLSNVDDITDRPDHTPIVAGGSTVRPTWPLPLAPTELSGGAVLRRGAGGLVANVLVTIRRSSLR